MKTVHDVLQKINVHTVHLDTYSKENAMKSVLRAITKVTECVLNASKIVRLVPTVTSAHLASPTHFCSKAGVWSIGPSVTFQFHRRRIPTSQLHTVKHASRDVQNVTSRLLDVLNVAKGSTCTSTSV